MRIVIIAIASLIPLFGRVVAEESSETIYGRWIVATHEGDYDRSLLEGMKLYHYSQSIGYGQYCYGETPFEIDALFDIGNTLIHLSRWNEARFCLTKFLVHVQSDEELLKMFGPQFSKKDWLNRNKIEDQQFYQETKPKG